MLKTLDSLLGLIAPHQCLGCGRDGGLLCADCQELLPVTVPRCYRCAATTQGGRTCRSCRRSSPLREVSVYADYDGFAEALVGHLKFEHTIAAAPLIASYLNQLITTDGAVIVPVPTATGRVRLRGYDQALLIAKHASKLSGLPYSDILERFGQVRQTGSGRRERLAQLEGAFAVKPRVVIPHSVLLVDDVVTTGATLESAARVLRRAGAKHVSALTFARAI